MRQFTAHKRLDPTLTRNYTAHRWTPWLVLLWLAALALACYTGLEYFLPWLMTFTK